jgi:N6-L-threonylcarbamoyladenine synthase
MLQSGDLNFSFSGLKTAVLTLTKKNKITQQTCADIALAFQDAAVDVLTEKSLAALKQTGLDQLVVAGGVGANRQLRNKLSEQVELSGATVFFPELEFCTDNGAMIAFAGAMRLQASDNSNQQPSNSFTVKARWDLELLKKPIGS